MLFILLLSLVSLVSTQTIVPTTSSSSFPGCALSCSPLLQAQTLCVPPSAPVSNEATYVNCFCQSSLLSTLYSTPDGPCDSVCTIESDRQLLQSWYKNFCASGGAGAIVATTTVAPTTLLTSTGSNDAAATASGTSQDSTSATSQSWIGSHWRWVMMLGILMVGLALLALLAVCLKRRHRRKLEAKRASASGFPIDREKAGSRASNANLEALFGPAQHMAATRGWEYPHDQDKALETGPAASGSQRKESGKVRREHSGRGKDRDRIDVHEVGGEDSITEIGSSPSRPGPRKTKSQRRRERETEQVRNHRIGQRSRSSRGKDVERDRGFERS